MTSCQELLVRAPMQHYEIWRTTRTGEREVVHQDTSPDFEKGARPLARRWVDRRSAKRSARNTSLRCSKWRTTVFVWSQCSAHPSIGTCCWRSWFLWFGPAFFESGPSRRCQETTEETEWQGPMRKFEKINFSGWLCRESQIRTWFLDSIIFCLLRFFSRKKSGVVFW